jgi:hypothetical protein
MRFLLLRNIRAGGGGQRGARVIYCLGFIQYRDDLMISRRTAFFFGYALATERFERVDNPDYNYAD